MDILQEVENIFREFFDDETITLNRETTADDVEGWDSLAQLNLVVLIEKHFKIKFKIDEIFKLAKIGDIIDAVSAKIGQGPAC
jgi:acyl carrier protein